MKAMRERNGVFKFSQKCIEIFTLFGFRPIIMLDSDLGQLDWIEIPRLWINWSAIKHFNPILFKRISLSLRIQLAENKPVGTPFDLHEIYRGIDLLKAIEYSLYVSLNISKHEFDLANRQHLKETYRWFNIAKSITDELIDYFDKEKPSIIVVMQGYFIEAAIARQLADRYSFQVVALENTLHSQRLIFEPITGLSVNKTSIMAWFNRPFAHTSQNDRLDPESWLNMINAMKHQDHKTPSTHFSWPSKRKKILFLGQCLTDSSVLFGIDRPYSTIEIIRYLMDYLSDRAIFLFVKLHPKENGGINPLCKPYGKLTLRKIIEKGLINRTYKSSAASDGFYLDDSNQFSTNQLIRDVDVVVTINSQAGLEALALGKEVLLLGQAFYDRIGCTWNVPDLSVLDSCLDAVLIQGKSLNNKTKLSEFLDIYFEKFCIKKDAESLVNALAKRRISKGFFTPTS